MIRIVEVRGQRQRAESRQIERCRKLGLVALASALLRPFNRLFAKDELGQRENDHVQDLDGDVVLRIIFCKGWMAGIDPLGEEGV